MKFRSQALEQLSAPEQLDEVVRLATIPSWLLTATLGVVVIATALWAALGTVATSVQATGILIQSAGISTLEATAEGQVVKVWVAPSELVGAGTPLYTLRNSAGRSVTIDSPERAAVASLQISDGQLLMPGTPVLELEPIDQPGEVLEVAAFVPADYAAALTPGIPVQVSSPEAPSSVFGTLQGTVSWIAAFPATADSLRAFLGNSFDVLPLLSSGSVVRVVILLDTMPGSTTVLKWSKQSPPFQLDTESQVSASFTIARQHPINWLLGR